MTTDRLLVVGEAPSRSSDPAAPLSGRSGSRLADLAGITLADWVARSDRINLLATAPEKAGKGYALPFEEARFRARLVVLSGRRVLLLGRRVARAFGTSAPLLEWWSTTTGGPLDDAREFAILPHPSGVNRWWNEPANVAAAAEFLKEALCLTATSA